MNGSANVYLLEERRVKDERAKAEMDLPLYSGGGDGTFIDMEALVNAKIEAAEARTDAKFAQVLAKLDTLTTEVRSSRSSIWTAAFAIMGLFLAVVGLVLAVAPSAFSAGVQMREIARDEARAAAVVPRQAIAPAPSKTPGK